MRSRTVPKIVSVPVALQVAGHRISVVDRSLQIFLLAADRIGRRAGTYQGLSGEVHKVLWA